MKKHLSFIVLFAALFCGSSAFATSAYYTFPKGGFAAGMTANSDTAEATFFLPHIPNSSHVFNSSDSVVWQSGGDLSKSKKTYSFSSKMKKTYHTPHIAKESKMSFQYGSTNTAEFDTTLIFHVGDSVMRYMTPARLWTDLEAESNGYKEGLGDNYRTWIRDTMGVYFNNIDIMYVDGLSIPISAGSTDAAKAKTEDDMFPEGAHVIVNIYKADSIAGKTGNKTSRSEVLWTGTLTKADFTPFNKDARYRGALNVEFKKPLIIEGPFVVELSDVKHSGCHFYVFSDKSNNRNRWGYYVEKGVETYPKGYCMAASVHAMFPALTQAVGDSLTVIMRSTGASEEGKNRPYRAIYSNVQYDPNSNDWEIFASEGLSMDFGLGASGDYTNWRFSMDANKTEDIRYEEFSITFRGQNLTYKIVQAPMLKSFTLAESSITIESATQTTLTPILVPETTDQTVFTWATSNESVAQVNKETGLITGIIAGTATITATSKANPELTATCEVTVISSSALPQTKQEMGRQVIKTIENGQLVIIRDGKRFSILGATL